MSLNRRLIIYLIFTLFAGCAESKTDFVVKLNSRDGYGMFETGNVIVFPSFDSLEYRNTPTGIDEFVVRSLPLQHDQYLWNLYLEKKIGKEQFERVINHYRIDTTKLSNSDVDCEVLFLIGTKGDQRVIIVDSDNDEDFGDEEMLEYEYPLSIEKQKEIAHTLPVVSTQYEYFENNQVITRAAKVEPSPYKGSLELLFNTDNQTEKKYFLFAGFPEYKTGNIVLNGLDYEVFVSNGFSSVDYPSDKVSVFICANSDSLPSELDGDIPYKIGDIFNAKGHDYSIDSVSNWGDNLFLRYVGENTKPIGITEGYYMPKFEAKRLDNSMFELEQYPNKYILIDFWGTWCNPCIKLIPELKKINSEFPHDKFVLVSVAYDNDPREVADFISDENMDWEHIFVNQNQENKNSLIEKLKISTYPTTILIGPDGKVVARNMDIEKLRALLNDKISTQVLH